MRTALYRAAQRLAAPDDRGRILRLVETARPGRCLDVGCGPDSWLARAGRTAIGVDLDPAYAAACRERGCGWYGCWKRRRNRCWDRDVRWKFVGKKYY